MLLRENVSQEEGNFTEVLTDGVLEFLGASSAKRRV